MTTPIVQMICLPINAYFASDSAMPTWLRAVNLVCFVIDGIMIEAWMRHAV